MCDDRRAVIDEHICLEANGATRRVDGSNRPCPVGSAGRHSQLLPLGVCREQLPVGDGEFTVAACCSMVDNCTSIPSIASSESNLEAARLVTETNGRFAVKENHIGIGHFIIPKIADTSRDNHICGL
jgi:hypothetical protein